MARPVPVSVVETPEFLAATRRIMNDVAYYDSVETKSRQNRKKRDERQRKIQGPVGSPIHRPSGSCTHCGTGICPYLHCSFCGNGLPGRACAGC